MKVYFVAKTFKVFYILESDQLVIVGNVKQKRLYFKKHSLKEKPMLAIYIGDL